MESPPAREILSQRAPARSDCPAVYRDAKGACDSSIFGADRILTRHCHAQNRQDLGATSREYLHPYSCKMRARKARWMPQEAAGLVV